MSDDSIQLSFDVTVDMVQSFEKALREMTAESVLVGFPADEKPREDDNGNPTPITNAALGYIHDKGAPEQNIPARPFMIPGIESVEGKIADGMEKAGIAALDGNSQGVEARFHDVGLTAQAGIRNKITDGPFAPLAESTLRARARRGGSIGKAAQTELNSQAAGNAPNPDNARPLIETGQLRNAVQYVIRKEGE